MNKPLLVEAKEGCVARAMEIIGSKWTALILRDLSLGPKRFCEIERSIIEINPRTLSKRLLYLEDQNIIIRDPLNNSNLGHQYVLTKKGEDLIPIVVKMSDWGSKYSEVNI